MYLHGRSTPAYTGAEGDGFVLSSSEFGRAYLSDGWATSFIREILRKYVVVFVGYTADDPPVQYLLEALRRASGKLENAYAFQSGDHNDAAARWQHKGVEAIPYSPDNAHAALWQSLRRGQSVHVILMLGMQRSSTHPRRDRQQFSPMSEVRWRMLFQPMKA